MRWTNENLERYALQPVMQWLIWAARSQSTITYSQAEKLLLGIGFNYNPRAAQRVGSFVAGGMMEKIGLDSGVPPLNVLLINEDMQLPNSGFCRDLAIWRSGDLA